MSYIWEKGLFLYGTATDFVNYLHNLINVENCSNISVIVEERKSSEKIKLIKEKLNILPLIIKSNGNIIEEMKNIINNSVIEDNEVYFISINWGNHINALEFVELVKSINLNSTKVIFGIKLEEYTSIELLQISEHFFKAHLLCYNKSFSWGYEDLLDPNNSLSILQNINEHIQRKYWAEIRGFYQKIGDNAENNIEEVKRLVFTQMDSKYNFIELLSVYNEMKDMLHDYRISNGFENEVKGVLENLLSSNQDLILEDFDDDHRMVGIKLNLSIPKTSKYIIALIKRNCEEKFLKHIDEIVYFYTYNLGVYMTMARYIDTRRKAKINGKVNIIGQLTSGILHDINNILASIIGQTEMIMEKEEDKRIKDSLSNILRSARDGGEVVKRIVNFNKVSANTQKLFDIGEVVRGAVNITKPIWYSRAQVQGKNIDISMDIEEGTYVFGCEYEIREALVNLIINAADAVSINGIINIRVYKRGNSVLIRIKDNGCGMSAEVKAKLFKPFFSTKGKQGTGLGLSIVDETVKNMGGTIRIRSEIGKGTEFIIRLPLPTDNINEEKKDEDIEVYLSKKIKVLIVDDQVEIGTIASQLIKAIIKCDVEIFTNSTKAVECISNKKYDLIITDLAMPGLNGIEVVKAAKKAQKGCYTVVMTGWIDGINDENKVHVDYILNKPFTLKEIKTMISKLFNLNKSYASEG